MLQAEKLDLAQQTATATDQFPPNAFDIETAYQIQTDLIRRRLDRNESLCGIKLGFTSRAKMQQMGVDDLIWGRLTDSMQIPYDHSIDLTRFGGAGFIHPRAEPEICFRLGCDIDAPVDRQQALASIDAVCTAIELIDSRYENFKFSLPDVIADNASSAAFCLGPWQAWSEFEEARASEPAAPPIHLLGVAMTFGDRLVQTGSTAAILGDPIDSIVQASRLATRAGLSLPSGFLILAGSPTAAEFLPAQPAEGSITIEAQVATLPAARFHLASESS